MIIGLIHWILFCNRVFVCYLIISRLNCSHSCLSTSCILKWVFVFLLFCPIIRIKSNLPSILYFFHHVVNRWLTLKGVTQDYIHLVIMFHLHRHHGPVCQVVFQRAQRSGTPAVLMQSESYWRKNPDVALHSGLLKLPAVKVLCLTVLIKMGTLTDITA